MREENMKREKRMHRVFVLAAVFVILAAICVWQNNSIVVSEHYYESLKVPGRFNGFRIVQVSDLHNKMFGESQSRLLDRVEGLDPDIIVVTGDLIDRRKFNLEAAMCFINGAVEIAPVYYISGNHEAWSGKYDETIRSLSEVGVFVIDGSSIEVSKGQDSIRITGSPNPDLFSGSLTENGKYAILNKELNRLKQNEGLNILLAHHPELFGIYSENGFDLTFAGHAHGGQFRIPFMGGLFAPDQGLFPEYSSGRYVKGNSTMIVSRGLGNSIFPIRINNPPEIIVIDLKVKDEKALSSEKSNS